MSGRLSPPIIALLTDFGLQDPYVGVMKGVLWRLCPAARLADLTHAIAPGDVRGAAFALWSAYPYFPPETVFLVVVDPGVGSLRRPVAVGTERFTFVGPDNGVFSEVLREEGAWRAVQIAGEVNPHEVLSATFHGRDLFAPAAARLACGAALYEIGSPLDDLVWLEPPRFAIEGDRLEGEIIALDRFGNAVSSIGTFFWCEDGTLELRPRLKPAAKPLHFDPATAHVYVGKRAFSGITRAYADAAPGEATPLIGSTGLLEIAVNQGSAAEALGLAVGQTIIVHG